MKTSDFDYVLPPEQIAQTPVEPRDASRLLILRRSDGSIEHRRFWNIGDYLKSGDLLVFNQTRVIPARLRGRKVPTGGHVEFLLLHQEDDRTWRGLVGGRHVREGTRLLFSSTSGASVEGVIVAVGERAERLCRFDEPLLPLLEKLGEVPLPPYIHQAPADPARYQTVYARDPGSAAAPTAGLHFTPELLLDLSRAGILMTYCTLHIGLDTFQPVTATQVEDHKMHTEQAILTAESARMINEARLAGGRIIAVGTTSVRVLETAALRSAGVDGNLYGSGVSACPWKLVTAIDKATDLFIRPGYRFRAVDALITNFHLPRSTLLMLVSAFAGISNGRSMILQSYQVAQEAGYRFSSFGDAIFLI